MNWIIGIDISQYLNLNSKKTKKYQRKQGKSTIKPLFMHSVMLEQQLQAQCELKPARAVPSIHFTKRDSFVFLKHVSSKEWMVLCEEFVKYKI